MTKSIITYDNPIGFDESFCSSVQFSPSESLEVAIRFFLVDSDTLAAFALISTVEVSDLRAAGLSSAFVTALDLVAGSGLICVATSALTPFAVMRVSVLLSALGLLLFDVVLVAVARLSVAIGLATRLFFSTKNVEYENL